MSRRSKLVASAVARAAEVMQTATDGQITLIDRLNRTFKDARLEDYGQAAALAGYLEQMKTTADHVLGVMGCDDLVGDDTARAFVITRLLTMRRGGRPRLDPTRAGDRLIAALHGIPLPGDDD